MVTSAQRAPDMTSEPLFTWLLWLLAGLLLAPAVATAGSVSWERSIGGLTLGVAAMAGVLIAAALNIGPWARTRLRLAAVAAPLIAFAVFFEIIGTSHVRAIGTASTLASLLIMYMVALGALIPLLIVRLRQTWLALVMLWATVVGVWPAHLSTLQVFWLTFLLLFSLLAVGVSHLRDEARYWIHFRLSHTNQARKPLMWAIVLLSLVIALIGVAPLNAIEIGQFHALYQRTVLAHANSLTYGEAQATPVVALGAPLSIYAPVVTSNTPVAQYTLQQGPTAIPPLFGATLDTFDGTTWRQSPTTREGAPPKGAFPADTQTVKATITVDELPALAGGLPLLLGFGQPVSFSLANAQAQVLNGVAPSALSTADWSIDGALPANSSYTVTSVVIPADATPSGTLPPALQQNLTQTPAALQALLRQTAQQWVGNATTPYDQAEALFNSMRAHLILDQKVTPPIGGNAVNWFIQHKRGNVLLWTTTFILLGRSIGLPMRLAEGYLPGTYNKQLKQWDVHASDATVWAQLAIPGVGWGDFFPGAHLIPVTKPQNADSSSQATSTPTPAPTPAPRRPRVNTTPYEWLPTVIIRTLEAILIMLALLVVGMFAAANYRLWKVGRRADPLDGFFARVALLARWAGVQLRGSDTASEAAAKVGNAAPKYAALLSEMNDLYEQRHYGRPDVLPPDASPNVLRSLWHALYRTLGKSALIRLWRRRWRHPQGSHGA